jgi:hypothetical protein
MNRYKAGQDAVVANIEARAAAADGKAAPVVLAAAVPEVSLEEIAIARTCAEAAGDIALNAAFPVDGGKQSGFSAEAISSSRKKKNHSDRALTQARSGKFEHQ